MALKQGIYLKCEIKLWQPDYSLSESSREHRNTNQVNVAVPEFIVGFLKLHGGVSETQKVQASRGSVSYARPPTLCHIGRLHSRRETA